MPRAGGERGDRTFGFFSGQVIVDRKMVQTSVTWVTSARGVPGGAGADGAAT
jgi:hypothetical protein